MTTIRSSKSEDDSCTFNGIPIMSSVPTQIEYSPENEYVENMESANDNEQSLFSPNEESKDNASNDSVVDPSFQQFAMELNVALEALETMRRANLEFEFSTAISSLPSSLSSSLFAVDHNKCTYCQRETLLKVLSSKNEITVNMKNNVGMENGNNQRENTFDGRRIRALRNRFLSKSASTLDVSDVSHGISKFHATESCPAGLGCPKSQNNRTMEDQDTYSDVSSGSNSIKNMAVSTNPRRKPLAGMSPRSCLTCGHPTCTKHTSPMFSSHRIPICQPCAYLFELDFLIDVITQDSESNNLEDCRSKVSDIIDCYDRATLLLKYTAQYTDEIVMALQSRMEKSNRIGVTANTTGIVSGVTGVVGCGALLFPPVAAVGVPLLIASLVFGGTANAVHTGNYAAIKYFSEPNALADKMVALHGMILSLLRIVEVLTYGLLKSPVDDAGTILSPERDSLAIRIHELLEKHGVTSKLRKDTITSSAKMSATSIAYRHTRFFGRVGSAAAASFRFVPIFGGVLSAASLMVEGAELKRTLAQMNDGSPCEKSDKIQSIRDELELLPQSALIAAECRRLFELAKTNN